MLFSARNGYAARTLQRESLDQATRNRLWTVLVSTVFNTSYYSPGMAALVAGLWSDVAKQPIDTYRNMGESLPLIRRDFLNSESAMALCV